MSARARLTPYWLILPAWVWLGLLFIVPLVFMLSVSLMTGNLISGFTLTWHVSTYTSAISEYHTQLLRSLLYGARSDRDHAGRLLPVAYCIAFRGGRHKSSVLFLLLLPFFVSFVIRTQQWSFLLADNGLLIQPLKDVGILSINFHVLATPWAVIGGLAYNSVPFMVMPIYVALERIDGRLIEAATDLFATRRQAVARVVAAPVATGGVRRLPAHVRPRRLGLRQRLDPRRPGHDDDRQHHPDRVLHQQRLPDGGIAVVRADDRAARRRAALRPGARHRGRAAGGNAA